LTYDFYRKGKERTDLTIKDLEPLINSGAFNEMGGLYKSDIIEKNLIDAFVPFLPLEKEHIESCIIDYLKQDYNKPNPRQDPGTEFIERVYFAFIISQLLFSELLFILLINNCLSFDERSQMKWNIFHPILNSIQRLVAKEWIRKWMFSSHLIDCILYLLYIFITKFILFIETYILRIYFILKTSDFEFVVNF